MTCADLWAWGAISIFTLLVIVLMVVFLVVVVGVGHGP